MIRIMYDRTLSQFPMLKVLAQNVTTVALLQGFKQASFAAQNYRQENELLLSSLLISQIYPYQTYIKT